MGRVLVTTGMGEWEWLLIHVFQNSRRSTPCERSPTKCRNVTTLQRKLAQVVILRLGQLSVCILNIYHRLLIQ